jgi:hypothetical protein
MIRLYSQKSENARNAVLGWKNTKMFDTPPNFLSPQPSDEFSTSFPGLSYEDEARHEKALVWAGHVTTHSRTQSPSYARSTERDKGLWPNPYQTGIWLATTKVIVLIRIYSITMFSWYPVLDLARAPRRAARKKGSGYENAPVVNCDGDGRNASKT